MIVLVTGGRKGVEYGHVTKVLDALHADTPIDIVVHGGALGTDTMADAWARRRGVQPVRCDALWEFYDRDIAGMRRNRLMLELKPNVVLAFPGKSGTANMVKQAREAGYKVIMVPPCAP